MATTREKIDSRGKSLLQLLTDNETGLSNVMNPSAKDQAVYKGPDPNNPVDIFYPRRPSKVGDDISDSNAYFLREFNLNDNVGSLKDLPEEENTAFVDRFAGKLHDQPFQPNQKYTSDGNDRSNFMKLKGRKSLLTLYWEMRGAFVNNDNRGYFRAQGQDGQDKTYTNNYSNTDADTYVEQFHNQTAEFYFPPTGQTSLIIAAQAGFNLGQPIQQNYSVIDDLRNKGKQLSRDWIETLGNSPADEFLKSFFNVALGVLVPTGRVSQLYRPGWSRPAQPVLEKVPFC